MSVPKDSLLGGWNLRGLTVRQQTQW